MNHYFVICDEEKDYVDRFSALLNERQMVPYEIAGITNKETLESFCREHAVDILLIDEGLYDEEAFSAYAKKVFQLSGSTNPCERERVLFKYQPVSAMIETIMEEIQDSEPIPGKKTTEMIGVYSPIKGSRKTLFALALGQVLAKERAVIYLNFQSLTGLHELLGQSRQTDLTDVLYLVKQGKSAMHHWKEKCIHTINNLDYILPVISPLDLREARASDWLGVVDALEDSGKYQTIVIEADESCEAFLPVLQRCSKIYMPIREDSLSAAQLLQYEQLMHHTGQSPLMKKTVFVKPPYHNGFGDKEQFVEQLIWGELGDYVRGLLWGN